MIKIVLVLLFMASGAFADGEFIKHDSNLMMLTGKIHADEKAIRQLLEDKKIASTREQSLEIAKQVKELLKSRKENIEKFNKELHHVRFEHPEKDGKFETRYKRFDEKSIKEFEDEIDKALSNVYQNIKNKYKQE